MSANRIAAPILVAAVLGAALASYAVAEPASHRGAPARECIDPTFAGNWTKYDNHTILVQSGRRTFRVTTSACPRLSDPLPRISTVVRGGDSICGPHDVQLFVSGGGPASPCFVDSITPLSQDEARAMEKSRR